LVFGRDPDGVDFDDVVPDASNPVDKHEQEEEELQQTDSEFEALFEFQIPDNPSESQESDQLHQTEQLVLFIRFPR
jgi:hypothetical protein